MEFTIKEIKTTENTIIFISEPIKKGWYEIKILRKKETLAEWKNEKEKTKKFNQGQTFTFDGIVVNFENAAIWKHKKSIFNTKSHPSFFGQKNLNITKSNDYDFM